jgi:hypothetical protein
MMAAKTLIGFVGSHGDALEFLDLTEKVLDEMTPVVEFRVERQWHCPPRML